jgi:hypothetical protein
MPTLFSYVVHHDFGLSPNPYGGFCTLAFCKFRREDGMPNAVELAQLGDWAAFRGAIKLQQLAAKNVGNVPFSAIGAMRTMT